MSERSEPDFGDAVLVDEEVSPASTRHWRRWRRARPLGEGESKEQPGVVEEGGEEAGPSPEVLDATRKRAARRRKGRHLLHRKEADAGTEGGASPEPGYSGPVLPELGPRSAARARRRRIRFFLGGAALLLAVAAAVTLLAPRFSRNPSPPERDPAPTAVGATDSIRTLLLFGTTEKDAPAASWMTLLSLNDETNEGSVVYIPAHTAAEVPGRGLLGLGESLGSGGPSLLEVSTETLIGFQVDDRLMITEAEALALFERSGELTVDVPTELRVAAGANEAQVLIPSGTQELTPTGLVSLLFRFGIGGDDAELGSRHLAFWSGLLAHYGSDPEGLANAVSETSPPLAAPAATARVSDFLAAFAEVPEAGRTLANLPVREVSVGGDELYQTDEEELSAFIEDTVGPTDLAADVSRVQVLNGNGVPGIGAEVADKLSGNGYEIALSGNADRLDYYKTRIISYDDSPESVEAAHRARDLLGTGIVRVSPQGQGIVDLTIVVGRDFLRTS
ncbi:MAG TPA: LytR C-terminal domain-containing protein [Actinomycetota bacterium]|nr:LytR C-terminal domain-containing protein [Actinomycetota bacterium]